MTAYPQTDDGLHGPRTQTPAVHTSPAWHCVSQLPQCVASVLVLTHVPPHVVGKLPGQLQVVSLVQIWLLVQVKSVQHLHPLSVQVAPVPQVGVQVRADPPPPLVVVGVSSLSSVVIFASRLLGIAMSVDLSGRVG